MSPEDDLRHALQHRAERVRASANGWRLIAARLDPKPRRGRRRLAALAAAVLVATIGLVVAVRADRSGPDRLRTVSPPPLRATTTPSSAVPWINSPVTTTSIPTTTTTTTTPPPGRRCRAVDLKASFGRTGFATGHVGTTVVLTNVSASTCVLSGYPGLTGIQSSGHRAALDTSQHGGFVGDLPPASLPPGAQGELLLGTGDVCPALNQPDASAVNAELAAHSYVGVIIELPDGGGSVEADHVQINTACGLSVSQLGAEPPPPPDTTVPPPGALASLTANLSLPAQAHAGATLSYLVTLANPGTIPVALQPCPSYTEFVYAPGSQQGTARSYLLNCAPVKTILPGHSVAFAMELAVPPDIASGQAKFSWQLNIAGDLALAAGGGIQIAP